MRDAGYDEWLCRALPLAGGKLKLLKMFHTWMIRKTILQFSALFLRILLCMLKVWIGICRKALIFLELN